MDSSLSLQYEMYNLYCKHFIVLFRYSEKLSARVSETSQLLERLQNDYDRIYRERAEFKVIIQLALHDLGLFKLVALILQCGQSAECIWKDVLQFVTLWNTISTLSSSSGVFRDKDSINVHEDKQRKSGIGRPICNK